MMNKQRQTSGRTGKNLNKYDHHRIQGQNDKHHLRQGEDKSHKHNQQCEKKWYGSRQGTSTVSMSIIYDKKKMRLGRPAKRWRDDLDK